jgi:hypothetical protein
LVSRVPAAVAAALALAVAAAGCGSAGAGDPTIKTSMIGQAGGQAVSINGRVKVQFPPGALESSVAITIQEVDPPGPGALFGPVFEIGPSATRLVAPATVALEYDPVALGAGNPSDLRVATYVQGAWQPVTSSVNAGVYVVSAEITHFSPWSLLMRPDPPLADSPDAGGSPD